MVINANEQGRRRGHYTAEKRRGHSYHIQLNKEAGLANLERAVSE